LEPNGTPAEDGGQATAKFSAQNVDARGFPQSICDARLVGDPNFDECDSTKGVIGTDNSQEQRSKATPIRR
jgi:hypothetical protein